MKLLKNKTFVIVAIVVIIIVAGIFIFLSNKKSSQQPNGEENTVNNIPGQEQTYTVTASKEDDKNNLYTDSQYGFSFQYPKDFTATKFSDQEDTSTILVQYQQVSTNIANDSSQVSEDTDKYPKNSGFQIFISWFDEPGPITKERVLQDLPDLTIKNAEQRVLKNGVPALIFFSEEPSLGETREIWFINNGYLYQVTATKEIDSLVAQIVGTWKFE